MSLSLLQSYSSAEEEEEKDDAPHQLLADEISNDDHQNAAVSNATRSYKPFFDTNSPSSSSLPSALCSRRFLRRPPQFLNTSIREEVVKEDEPQWRHGGRRNQKEKKGLPSVAYRV